MSWISDIPRNSPAHRAEGAPSSGLRPSPGEARQPAMAIGEPNRSDPVWQAPVLRRERAVQSGEVRERARAEVPTPLVPASITRSLLHPDPDQGTSVWVSARVKELPTFRDIETSPTLRRELLRSFNAKPSDAIGQIKRLCERDGLSGAEQAKALAAFLADNAE
jgi:hypothetical protein